MMRRSRLRLCLVTAAAAISVVCLGSWLREVDPRLSYALFFGMAAYALWVFPFTYEIKDEHESDMFGTDGE